VDAQERLSRLASYIDRMPSLPPTVTKVLEICNDRATSPVDLNRVISLDPVLMARVLKLINSAYYGLPNKVVSMVRAIIMLGINTVKNLALSTAVMDTLNRKTDLGVLNPVGFWRHSLAVGVTTRLLAKMHGEELSTIDEYFVAGLLHDIGKIPMDRVLAKEYVEVIEYCREREVPLHVAEREFLGFDHADCGRLIVDTWRLPTTILDTVTYHHRPAEYRGANSAFVYAVHTANYFVNASGIGESGDNYPAALDESAREGLGVDQTKLSELANLVDGEVQKAENFLKVV